MALMFPILDGEPAETNDAAPFLALRHMCCLSKKTFSGTSEI